MVVDIRDLWPDVLLDMSPTVLRPLVKPWLSSMARRTCAALGQAFESRGDLGALSGMGRRARRTTSIEPRPRVLSCG